MRKLDLCAVAACALFAQPAVAQFSVFATTPDRWGAGADVIGTRSFTVEDFEDTTLVPGLQVSWFTGAGNSGPVSALPNTFDPTTDPFGTAWVGGNWDGARVLINTLDNQSHNYFSSQFFGSLQLTFNPPVAAVGFSMQQANAEVRLLVNGVDRGSLVSLTSLPFSGGRQGYIVVESTGAERISTLRLNNNSGDGWAVDHVAFTEQARIPVFVRGFTQWGLNDAGLGIVALLIEDFEDTQLKPGLLIGVESPLGNRAPSNTLPITFDQGSDVFGTAFANSAWDGTHSLLNTRDNQPHAYGDVGNWGDTVFQFATSVGIVGFSVEDEDQPAGLLVNGRNVGDLLTIAGLAVHGRNGYVRISSSDSLITDIFIRNGRSGFNDGLAFDHLAFGPACRGDLDGDHIVNTQDLTLLLARFGQSVAPASAGDINGDGLVDTNDLVLFLIRFGQPCS